MGKQPIVIYAGTSIQCGLNKEVLVNETLTDVPITVYDFNKLEAERYLKFAVQSGWIKGASLRLTNVYGPGPKSSSSDRGVLNLMMRKDLKGETLTVYGQGDFISDYVYIDDVISAFLKTALSDEGLQG